MIQPTYRFALDTVYHQNHLANREALTYADYEMFYQAHNQSIGNDCVYPYYQTGQFRLQGIEGHKRMYEKVT